MSFTKKESTMVCPAGDTPNKSLWLSSVDLILATPFGHTRTVYIYHPSEPTQTNHPLSSTYFDSAIMKESLSRALVPYYPVAGRLRENEQGRIEIECNGKGVFFVEAETTHELADFGDFTPTEELRRVAIPECDYSGGLSSFPLLLVQLTRFRCGGVSLGFGTHHHLADGISHTQFYDAWAKLARGDPLTVLPCHDRSDYLGPRQPRMVKFNHLEYDPPLPPKRPLSGEVANSIVCVYNLSNEQINDLILTANSNEVLSYKLTTFEVLAAHVWRTASRARNLDNDDHVKLYIPTDGRSILKDPALPPGYYGNVLFHTACIAKARDIIDNPIWYAASKIHEALDRTQEDEYMRSAIDYLESHQDISSLIRGARTVASPNLTINSWGKVTKYDVNFGWGPPKFMGHGSLRYEGQSFLIPTSNGDGSVSVVINLCVDHMTRFREFLYPLRSSL